MPEGRKDAPSGKRRLGKLQFVAKSQFCVLSNVAAAAAMS